MPSYSGLDLQYEVVRSADVFHKQQGLLDKLANPHSDPAEKRLSGSKSRAPQALANVTAVAEHYENKLREAGIRSANQGLRAVAKEIEKDGLSYGQDLHGADDPPYVAFSTLRSIHPRANAARPTIDSLQETVGGCCRLHPLRVRRWNGAHAVTCMPGRGPMASIATVLLQAAACAVVPVHRT